MRQPRSANLVPLRLRVMAEYSHPPGSEPKCICCGVQHEVMLTIDHVYGAASGPFAPSVKGKIGRRPLRGPALYSWIARNRFPKGAFQVLCFNCNIAKFRLGRCPHGGPVAPPPRLRKGAAAVQQAAKQDRLRGGCVDPVEVERLRQKYGTK